MSAIEAEQTPAVEAYPRNRLLLGLLGRTWLWCVGGCIAITLLPLLIGWHSFVVRTGSMEPRISVGDVVIASPTHDTKQLLGRVAVFTDPSRPDRLKVHRVVAVNPDGTLTTKGDANPTNDSAAVAVTEVQGMGRLLVRYVGLPLVWVTSGQWLWFLGFLLTLVVAGFAVLRDHEPDEPDPDDEDTPAGGTPVPVPTRWGWGRTSGVATASTPKDPTLREAGVPGRRPLRPGARLGLRALLALLAGAALLVPTANAAFARTTTSPGNAWAAGKWTTYSQLVSSLTPSIFWKLDETTGTTAADSAPGGGNPGTYNPNAAAFTRGVTGALPSDTPNLAVTLNGTTSCINTAGSVAAANAPASLTEIVWFKTTTTQGGKLLGWETPRTGTAVAGTGRYDRHIYMDGNGRVWFGVYNNAFFTISSPTTLNDGTWHMAAATLGPSGMALYIDGQQVGTNANTAGEATTGWWRAGCGNLAGWGGSWGGANSPTTATDPVQDRPFAGSLDAVSIWTSVLSPASIRTLFFVR